MNPQFHDGLVALCAIYYSGEISDEEWALLQIHMGYCDSCHERFLDYQRITSEVIPALAGIASSERDGTLHESAGKINAAERRLLRDVGSSLEQTELNRPRKFGWQGLPVLVTACLLVIACVVGVELTRMKSGLDAKATQTLKQPEAVEATSGPPIPNVQESLKRSQERVASLQQQVESAESQLKQERVAAAGVEKQLDAEEHAQTQLIKDRDGLGTQLAKAQTELDSLRNRLASAGKEAIQQTTSTAALETQVKELKTALDKTNVELGEKDQMLALDQDFLAHDRDIRDLIGARNLYIADIFDTTENGKTAKEFGRIFYTKDRSLVFYGFDLDSQAEHKHDVSFQVWGNGGDRSTPVSLGIFYEDDTHKRWVLRCNDAKTLARLDMVFVTVEPPGGSPKPTGRQLLRAYLQIHPNHS